MTSSRVIVLGFEQAFPQLSLLNITQVMFNLHFLKNDDNLAATLKEMSTKNQCTELLPKENMWSTHFLSLQYTCNRQRITIMCIHYRLAQLENSQTVNLQIQPSTVSQSFSIQTLLEAVSQRRDPTTTCQSVSIQVLLGLSASQHIDTTRQSLLNIMSLN